MIQHKNDPGPQRGYASAARPRRDVALTVSIGERARGDYKGPGCGGKTLEPLMGTFFSKTSRNTGATAR